MPAPIRSISRQVSSELRFLAYAKVLLVLLVLTVAAVVISFTASVSNAKSAHENFVTEVGQYEARGISLADALNAPVTVTRNGNQETIDNPLKYDYLEVGKSMAAVRGTTMAATALDFVTFLLVPLMMLTLGAFIANSDRRTRTSGLRAARERWSFVTAGKVGTLAVVSLAVPVVVVIAGLITGLVGSGAVADLSAQIDYGLVAPTAPPPLLPQILLTAGVALLFGVAGYAIGWVTRSFSWPIVLAAAALFALPFVSPWDPRNLLAVVGSQVYTFWGQFRLRPPIEVDTAIAGWGLLGYLVVAGLVVAASGRSVRLR